MLENWPWLLALAKDLGDWSWILAKSSIKTKADLGHPGPYTPARLIWFLRSMLVIWVYRVFEQSIIPLISIHHAKILHTGSEQWMREQNEWCLLLKSSVQWEEVCGKCQKGLWILRRASWPALSREGDGKQGWLPGVEDTSVQPWRSVGMHNTEGRKSILEEIESVETWERETAWCVPGTQHLHMVAAPSQRRRWRVTEAREDTSKRERTSPELSLMKEPPPLFKSHDSSPLSTHQEDGCNLELGLFCETGLIFLYSDPSTEARTAHKHLPTPGKSKHGLRTQLRKKNRWIWSLPVFKSPKSPSGASLDSTSVSPKATLSQVHPLQRLSSALSRVLFPKLLREGPCRGEKAHFPRSLWS